MFIINHEMDNYFAMLPTFLVLISSPFLLSIIVKIIKPRLFPPKNLPPGSLGWPLIGESIDFIRADMAGQPERFVRHRVNKYDSEIFKSSVFGEYCVVMCGQAANKFLYSNENKLVHAWWPPSVKKLFKSGLVNLSGDEAMRIRKMLNTFLSLDTLKRYIGMMDSVTHDHIRTHWHGKEVVKVYDAVKAYTFAVACQLFASIDNPEQISRVSKQLDILIRGVIDFGINIPGTRFSRAMKAAKAIREELGLIISQRRAALEKKLVLPTQDFLSHLLVTADANGRFMTEAEIADNILMLLYAGFDTTRSTTTLVFKYLYQLPDVYRKVLQEQIEIAESKEAGELLSWEDVRKMKYSWNAVCEVMRVAPPIAGGYREAMVDFTYAGYTIPKGWKLLWRAASTHKDPSIFPEPENFDASRFDGDGPAPFSFVPFGGGPRMCPGNEFGRLQLLVFLHNIVKRFKWELVNSDEHFAYDPMLSPSNGLPVRLHSL